MIPTPGYGPEIAKTTEREKACPWGITCFVARNICLSTGSVREERILDLVIERKTHTPSDNVVKSIAYKNTMEGRRPSRKWRRS
jgi:hypothetical protein